MAAGLNPLNVDLTTADPRDVVCALAQSGNEYNGHMGARISSIFVLLIVSSAATIFPILAKWSPRLRLPLYVYLFARYFGAGVIVSTAFVSFSVVFGSRAPPLAQASYLLLCRTGSAS